MQLGSVGPPPPTPTWPAHFQPSSLAGLSGVGAGSLPLSGSPLFVGLQVTSLGIHTQRVYASLST